MADINIGAGGAALTTITVNLVGKNYKISPPKQMFNMRLARMSPELGKMAKLGDLKLEGDEQDLEKLEEAMRPVEKLMDLITEWIDLAFTKKDAEAVNRRLNDGRDLLDFTHIMELVRAVSEHVSEESGEARPTT